MILRRFFSHSVQNFQKLLPVSSNKLISLESSPRNLRNFTTMKEETTKFFVPPPREPYNEKDDPNETNTYVDFTKDLYYKFIGKTEEKVIKLRSTYYALERNGQVYHVFDASKMPYGRMCARIAYLLQGKHKPIYRKHQAIYGDHCIVVNSLNLKITGKKKLKKTVKYHSGFVGHLKEIPIRKFIEEKPEQLITLCVSKMLPKNQLRTQLLEKLKVFREDHDIIGFPNFLPVNPYTYDPLVHENAIKELTKDDSVVVYESTPNSMGEFKDFKREEDPSLEQPLNERAFLPKNFTRDQLKRYKRYLEIAKRYKEHKFKPRKNNDPRTKDFFIIKSEKKIKKYHLDDLKEFLVEDADDDEADDTIK